VVIGCRILFYISAMLSELIMDLSPALL